MNEDQMLESLSLQLRDAEARRAEAERQHQVSNVHILIYTTLKAF